MAVALLEVLDKVEEKTTAVKATAPRKQRKEALKAIKLNIRYLLKEHHLLRLKDLRHLESFH